ncbi:MAG: formylglycine-generating enzyme family protein [Bacteroidetes bacterium]|nr:formylglycine-generating enzyme family protein [Bacteroidota bacterium]
MKQLIFIFLVLPLTWVKAQSVSGVEMSQVGKTVVVEYVLQASEPQEIAVYLSTDGGKTFSKPLEKVSGDVGKGIAPGNKRIVWNVLEELPELVGDNLVFMVEIAEGLIWEAKNGRPRMEWVSIPAGTFTMGSPSYETDRESDEGPQHSVSLSGFKMSKYEVTFAQYDAFCAATGRTKPSDEGWGRGNRPVINVDWNDATAFAQWMGCRLPTEAEWEYACRAGTTSPFNTGSCLGRWQANYNGNNPYSTCPKGTYPQKTMPVGSYAPNAWGLYDMHGNVYEWCSDWYGDYSKFEYFNSNGPTKGTFKIIRSGFWGSDGKYSRSANRNSSSPSNRNNNIGFRLVVPS